MQRRDLRSVLLPVELSSGVKFIVYVVTVETPEGKSEVRVTEQGSGTLAVVLPGGPAQPRSSVWSK